MTELINYVLALASCLLTQPEYVSVPVGVFGGKDEENNRKITNI